jgi:hypothetical protein
MHTSSRQRRMRRGMTDNHTLGDDGSHRYSFAGYWLEDLCPRPSSSRTTMTSPRIQLPPRLHPAPLDGDAPSLDSTYGSSRSNSIESGAQSLPITPVDTSPLAGRTQYFQPSAHGGKGARAKVAHQAILLERSFARREDRVSLLPAKDGKVGLSSRRSSSSKLKSL